MRNIYLIVLIVLLGCKQNEKKYNEKQSNHEYIDSGILILQTDSAYRNNFQFQILNSDLTLFGNVESVNHEEPSLITLKDSIRAYFPDYYIIHFDATINSDSLFRIVIGSTEKFIRKSKFVEFLSLDDYVLRFFSTTTVANPLRDYPSENAQLIGDLDYDLLNFRNVDISGDWLKVKCNNDCEGCGNGNEITGWLRWKKDGKLILDIFYTC